MTKYQVFMQRTITQETMVEIEADNRYVAGIEAEKKAHDNGDQFEWSTSDSETQIDEIREA